MMQVQDLLLRIRALLFGSKMDRDLEDEIEMHLELETRKYVLSGLGEEEAQRRARIALGGRARVTEECRDRRGVSVVQNFGRDCRQAARTIRRSPAFALTVIFTMALAVGANTTVFSFCRALLLATLPVPNPDELQLVSVDYPGIFRAQFFSYPDLQGMRSAGSGTATLTGFTQVVEVHIRNDSGTTGTIKGQLVAENFFSVLRIAPFLGRGFGAQDNKPGAEPVVALSYRLWQDRFGGDVSVIGRRVSIQRTPITVVAVMPSTFDGVEPGARPDVWMPLSVQSEIGYHGYASMNNVDWKKPWLWQDVSWLFVLARSPGGLGGKRLHAALTRLVKSEIAAQLPHVTDAHERSVMMRARVELTSASGGVPQLREQFSLPLRIVFALVGVLLFSGCVNIVNLLLARSRSQQHEIAIRVSLGSSRGRLIAHRMTETMLLVVIGGLLSVPFTTFGSTVILHWLALDQGLGINVGASWPVFGFTACITLIAGFAVALVPALQIPGMTIASGLGQRSRTQGVKSSRLASTLIGGQLALTIVSLVTAGLLTHSLFNYARLDLGVDRVHVLSVSIDPSAAGYDNAGKSNALYERLTGAVNRIPGVISSSVGGCGLMGHGCATVGATVTGEEKKRSEEALVERNYVGPKYFSTVGISLLRGREISAEDTLNTTPAGVVNEQFERQFLHGQSALGRMVTADGQTLRVVGVVRDARSDDIHQPAMPFLYEAVQQVPSGWNVSHLEIRTAVNPVAAANAVRAAIVRVDRAIPIAEVITLAEETKRTLARELLVGRLAGLFSALTLIVAAIGIYGVLAYNVSQRRGEFAIRMALGASKAAVIRIVAGQTSRVWIAGCVAGLLVSLVAARLIKSLLFETGTLDVWAYAGSLLMLLVISAAAAVLPAWRAASVDPARTLRGD